MNKKYTSLKDQYIEILKEKYNNNVTEKMAVDDDDIYESKDKINEISIDQLQPDQVCVELPWIFVNIDDDKNHEFISSYKVIDFSILQSLMKYAPKIETGDNKEQMDVMADLLAKINTTDDNETGLMTNAKKLLDAFTVIGKIYDDMDVCDNFVDITYEAITFNPIRLYVNDKNTRLLVSAKETVVDGISFYSQLDPNNTDLKLKIREKMNEDDLNQIYYVLEKFRESLLFKPTRICNMSIKILNMCILFLAIDNHSVPLRDKYLKDYYWNLIGYMMDVLIRSRVIQYWHKYPCTQQLLKELTNNYNKLNTMVAICKLTKAKDRAEYIINRIRAGPKGELFKADTYNSYINIINKYVFRNGNDVYYNFTQESMQNVLQLQCIELIISMKDSMFQEYVL